MSTTRIHLSPRAFGERERTLVEFGTLTASAFLYQTGVCGLRLANGLGELLMLPFQGQQIWSMTFGGRNQAMISMFPEPRATDVYLQTYGGFLLHCGATAMGVPMASDTHPLHGELPNAPYQRAWLLAGADEGGSYLALSGEYRHTVAFNTNYVARPEVRLYADSTRVPVSMTVENMMGAEMEYMYLAHANFRPVDGGRLVYSAECSPRTVRVRKSIPAHVRPPAGYAEFLAELAADPARHEVLVSGLAFAPEVVFFVDYLADEKGWAHTMQVHPDGSADYIGHRPRTLDHGVRWISRTGDQDALGMCLPATAEPEGYHAEKQKGNVKVLPAHGSVRFDMQVGYLAPTEAAQMERTIRALLPS